jgi:predicted HicB family RNase H-like nuclease
MVVKMPHTVKTAKTEREAEAFISGVSPTKPIAATKGKTTKTVVNMRFDPDLLARLDEAAKRRGVSRTAWIHWAVGELLDERDWAK